jgi:glycerol-3-phosphate acyltransferase PlsX
MTPNLFPNLVPNSAFRLGIDLMGADLSPEHILKAATSLPLDFYSNLTLVFFGSEEAMRLLHQYGKEISNIAFRVCPEVIHMKENPLSAIREKKESSLVRGIQSLKTHEIDAFISCANTGALIASAKAVIDTFAGIARPALLTEFPSHNGYVAMLDVGGSVESTSSQLLQFAFLGASYAHIVGAIERPRLALLNIGEEAIKGTDELKACWQKLKGSNDLPFDFVGNKEPKDVFTRQADVFVTSGFAGNIFVKTAEAVSSYVLDVVAAKVPTLNSSELIDEGRGAFLCGAKELIVKCHGNASISAIQRALVHAKHLLEIGAIRSIDNFVMQYTSLM